MVTRRSTGALGLLLLNSVSHLLVDALCAATIFGPVSRSGDLGLMILFYNTLAFSTQCVVGLAADRIRRHPPMAAFSMLLVVAGFALPVPAVLRILLVGLGNSGFHVAGGCMTLERSEGKAGPLGVFVAPGAIGLTLGILRPALGPVFAALLAVAASLTIPMASRAPAIEEQPPIPAKKTGVILPVLLLTAAVAVRAVGGSAVSFPWKTTAALTLLLTLSVWAGKTAGGFVCDRLGPGRSAWISVPTAAVLIAFCASWMLPSLAGQLALNLTMPVTLWLLYRAMPDSPGFAFGLAASALWPGTIAGQWITLTGPTQWILVLLCFLFGLAAILYAAKTVLPSPDGERRKPHSKEECP